MVLAWYLAQVFTSDMGAALPFHFPLRAAYWCGEAAKDAVHGDTIEIVRENSLANGDIRCHKMSKAYDSVTALKELSLTMKQDEIFCLLGHNGAGKTTAIKCLTGQGTLTNGHAFVYGHSVRDEMGLIQSQMGVCPQHDVLFEEMSGLANIQFWLGFKGQSGTHARAMQILEDVDLHESAK